MNVSVINESKNIPITPCELATIYLEPPPKIKKKLQNVNRASLYEPCLSNSSADTLY